MRSNPQNSLPLLAGALAMGWLFPRRHGLLQNAAGLPGVLRRFSTEDREVWLTIDDGPVRADIDGMLEQLERYGARATFFLVGKRAARYPHLVRKIVDSGHGVGNHSWAHRSATLWCEPRCCMREDLRKANHFLRVAGGVRPSLFRAPAGRWSLPLLKTVREEGLTPLGWSASGGDGMCCGDLWKSMNRLIASVSPGSILLLHQGGRKGRVEALSYLLHRLRQEGWKTVLPEISLLE